MCPMEDKMGANVQKIVNQLVENYKNHEFMTKLDSLTQPNREVIVAIIDNLQKLIFPGYFEMKHLKSETIHYYVGELVEGIHYNLKKQMVKAYRCTNTFPEYTREQLEEEAEKVCLEFLGKLVSVQELLETDVRAAYDGDPAAYSVDEIIYSYPGLYAIMVNRIAHELYLLNVPLIPRIMTEHAHSKTGIDIHPGATIGSYFFIDHGTGIVIGETTVIGERVKIYQGVTLGGISTSGGQSMKGTKRHPNIEDDVTIYSGASILGGDTTIGRGVVIGGNAFVTKSVPPNTKVLANLPELDFYGQFEMGAGI